MTERDFAMMGYICACNRDLTYEQVLNVLESKRQWEIDELYKHGYVIHASDNVFKTEDDVKTFAEKLAKKLKDLV